MALSIIDGNDFLRVCHVHLDSKGQSVKSPYQRHFRNSAASPAAVHERKLGRAGYYFNNYGSSPGNLGGNIKYSPTSSSHLLHKTVVAETL